MTSGEPRRKRAVGSGSLRATRAISQYPPKSAFTAASDQSHRTPTPRRPHGSSVTLTFDLQLPGG